jgi:hypothetical protein
MGMDMGAYVLTKVNDEGIKSYDFAPKEPFEETFLLSGEAGKYPSFQFITPMRYILTDVLAVDLSEAYLHIETNELDSSINKLELIADSYLSGQNERFQEIYHGLIEFFKICKQNGYSISAC